MGTESNQPSRNRATISRGGDTPARRVNPETGETDRSFAQPNPAIHEEEVTPKAHASEQDENEAITENSKLGRDYSEDADEEE